MELVPIVVTTGFFCTVFGIVYMIVTSRNRERMALIERGADPSLFEAKKRSTGTSTMKLGLFGVGIGLGVLMGNLLTSMGMNDEVAYSAMIFLFGGLGLIGANYIGLKMEKQEK